MSGMENRNFEIVLNFYKKSTFWEKSVSPYFVKPFK